MIAELIQVAEFHRTFKHPILLKPGIPDETRCQLRVDLIAEELQELREAIEQKNILGIADALADIQYVLFGAVHEFGLTPLFPQIFHEVHRSNMSKVCDTFEDAIETSKHYYEKSGITSRINPTEDGRYLVYREPDGKTLKSRKYSRADLESIIKPHLD